MMRRSSLSFLLSEGSEEDALWSGRKSDGRLFFSRGASWVLALVTIVVVAGTTAGVSQRSVVTQRRSSEMRSARSWWRRRARRYCSASLPFRDEEDEALDGLALLGATVAIRHGARSAIHEPQEAVHPHFDCELSMSVKRGLGFDLLSGESGSESGTDALAPSVVSEKTQECMPGQLLDRGFKQHLMLGSEVRERFGIDGGWALSYARSTDYRRTKASAAAFLAGAFPFVTMTKIRSWIQVFPTAREPMYGTGGSDGVGVFCPKASNDQSRQRSAFLTTKKLRDNLDPRYYTFTSNKANKTTLDRSIKSVADAVYSRTCDGNNVDLCLHNDCLDAKMTALVLSESDRFYCDWFSGTSGGRAATRLAMYPFLRELADGLLAQAKTNATLRLYSGHDTVIAPVAAALGFFDCKWPPLASYVLFELYGKKHDVFLRVLFNGKVVNVAGCPDDTTLCPLADFSKAVDALLDGAPDFDTACTYAPS